MTAKITIIDDNGNPKGAYELTPSIIRENGIITTYAFEFTYSQLNHDKPNWVEDKEVEDGNVD